MNLKEPEIKMLERVRAGLDTDANLSEDEKKLTRALYQGGYIGAWPVEGSDCAQDALWINTKGFIALGAPRLEILDAMGYMEVNKSVLENVIQDYPEEMAKLLNEGTDNAVMRADLLARETDKVLAR